MKTRRAIYAGSFDPLTNGHLWVIQRTVRLFDTLTIAIGENPEKSYFLSTDKRKADIQEALQALGPMDCQVDVQVISNQFLAGYAKDNNIPCLVRGIRSEADFSYEYAMSMVNREISPQVESIYLMPPPHLSQISSSLVKGLIGPKGWESLAKKYVPEHTLKRLKEKINS